MKTKYSLEILDSSHGEALGNLRREAYKAQFKERVDEAKLSWNQNDLLFLNLGIFSSNLLIACLRVSVIESDQEFERVTLQPPPPGSRYPLIVLSRGATLPEFSGKGLHSALRLCALKLVRDAGPWDVLGTMEENSLRIKQLERLGYKFEACPNQWDGFLKSSHRILLGTLKHSELSQAIERLEKGLRENNRGTPEIDTSFDIELAKLRLKTHSHRVSHERLDFEIDNEAMWNEVRPMLERFPRYDRSPSVGGWSLQAPPSDPHPIHAGWPVSFCPYNGPNNQGPTWTPRSSAEEKLQDIQSFVNPTDLCTPLISRLLERMTESGLTPRRARIIRMPPNASMRWHQDGSPRIYQVRAHLPLQTNSSSYFESEFGRVQMKSDGGIYFVHINRPHRAINEGPTDRYHLVVHAWDTQNLTKHHRYDSSLYQFETHHAEDVDLNKQFNFPPPDAGSK